MLAVAGMRPEAVGGGPEARAALARAREAGAPFRVILTDVALAGSDGVGRASPGGTDDDLAGTALVMVASARRPREPGHGGSAARHLTKPVMPAELVETIRASLDGSTRDDAGSPSDVAGPSPGPRPLRVLVAEDHPVNQRVAVRLLERQGHAVVAVDNGVAAIAALEREPFDVVLMDVQMPEMDGFKATATIRALEAITGRHVPIVALTAHAMDGDAERCLAAGMDGYLAKPLRPEDVSRTIVRLASGHAMPPPAPAADAASALAAVGGDRGLLAELVALFLGDSPRRLGDLRAAVESGDERAIHRGAHSLKAAVATFGGRRAQLLAAELEARSGDAAAAAELWERLAEEMGRFMECLAEPGWVERA
jgi:CheY-like chemotaxis protein